jgi:hypothetical protein
MTICNLQVALFHLPSPTTGATASWPESASQPLILHETQASCRDD